MGLYKKTQYQKFHSHFFTKGVSDMSTRITSATVLVKWDTKIHAHALLVYGKNPSQCKNYEEYALKVSNKQWSLEQAMKGFWGQGPRIPPTVYKYFMRNPISRKPKGFENGVRVQFEFGVAKIFDTGKALLTVSLKNVPREQIQTTLGGFARQVHDYIKQVKDDEELQWYATQLDVGEYSWDIVSLNSTATLFDKRIDLGDFYSYSAKNGLNVFYEPDYHKGYMQMYYHCMHKKNTVCVYHTGKCCIMGVKSISSLEYIETQLGEISQKYEMKLLSDVLGIDPDDEQVDDDKQVDDDDDDDDEEYYRLIIGSDSD